MAEIKSNPAELAALAAADSTAKKRLTYLYDEGRYTELDAYAANGDKLCGAVTAFGYVNGNACYAFSQDVSVNYGALNRAQAEKLAKVYDLAAKTGVPVVGIYDSCGADLTDGHEALNAYGELLLAMSNLSGVVPQIAVVAGVCSGTSALLAESADFTVVADGAELYFSPNTGANSDSAAKNGTAALTAPDDKAAVRAARTLLEKLPMNNLSPVPMYEFEAPSAPAAGDAVSLAKAILDVNSITEVYADYGSASYTALATLSGAAVGFVATNKTRSALTAEDCSKIARFVRTCDAFAIPVITAVDTVGFECGDECEAAGDVKSMAKLAHAYAEATTIKISAVTGRAYGAAFIALAGKGANADLSYAVNTAVITPLAPITAAEFLYHNELAGADDPKEKRLSLAARYAAEEGSPFAAAEKGCIDGVTTAQGLRRTLVSAVEILAGKRVSRLPKKHSNIQL